MRTNADKFLDELACVRVLQLYDLPIPPQLTFERIKNRYLNTMSVKAMREGQIWFLDDSSVKYEEGIGWHRV